MILLGLFNLTYIPVKCFRHSAAYVDRRFRTFKVLYSTNSSDDELKNNLNIKMPEQPQNCCMAGCANCVWLAYAEELSKCLNDGGEAAKQKILENVKDPNLRAFLMVELKHKYEKK